MKFLPSGYFILIIGLLFSNNLNAQYPPPAGQSGTTAMHMDSAAFISWASTCTIGRGYINMADTTVMYNGVNKATYGSYLYGSGPADGLVVSLGDHGTALLTFDLPIVNRIGPDFAVFENSFSDYFLELAFVEVSSDGKRFVRFPAVSLTSENEQVSTFETIEATAIHNFAGKYRLEYGTPFDLDEIKDSTGIDLSHITSIRIIDAGGCIQSPYATYDSKGHKVNDPWPTPFDTGGFDLDAIGVIHDSTKYSDDDGSLSAIQIYPNPVISKMTIISLLTEMIGMNITDLAGRLVMKDSFTRKAKFDLTSLPAGTYIARFTTSDGTSYSRKIVKN